MAERVISVVMMGLDRRRFPWLAEGREALEDERVAAIVASAALIAAQKVQTQRRNEGKREQESITEEGLLEAGLTKVSRRTVANWNQAPGPGEFCGESLFGSRKADFIVHLLDGRIMPIECKVSNSYTNSIKRLNNDAAAKAQDWTRAFGDRNTVPAAMLSGVFHLKNLSAAQEMGLTIFWAHEVAFFVDWVRRAR